MSDTREVDGLEVLREQGYLEPRWLPDGRWACICPLLFTHAIVVGTKDGMTWGYEDRWCYHTRAEAITALNAWDGTGEPDGWHRHPDSGRRRNLKSGEEWISR